MISLKICVRLNLFNHVLVLFRAEFACNLAIRYPVFRWDSCKDSVQNSVNKSCEWISRLASGQNGTRVKHARGVKRSQQLELYKIKLPVLPYR